MAIDRAKIIISADDKTRAAFTSAQQNMQRLSSTASSLKGVLGTLGVGLSVGAFAGFVKSSIDAADRLNDLSKSTSISVEQLSGLQLAARQSGTDLDGVAQAINKLSVNIGKDGEKFAKLGITAKEPLEAFKQLADVFVAIKDPQERAAVAAEALGKSWASAAPLLAEGGKAIGEMVDKGKQLSGITQEMAEQADKFNDQMEELKAATAQLGISIAKDLLPPLIEAVKEFQLGIKHAGGFGAALLSIGTINPFRNAQENIRAYTADLEKLEKNRPSGTGNAFGSVIEQEIARTDAAIKKKKSQIGFLREAAQEEALALGKGFEKYKIPNTPETPGAKPNTKGFLSGSSKSSRTASDPLASLLASTDIAKLAEFEKTVALLNQRFDSGRKSTDLYNQAMTKLVETTFKANFDEFNKQLKETEETEALIAEHLKATNDALYEQTQAWEEAGRALTEEMREPLEQANIDFGRLDELLQRGVITWETYARAVFKVQDSLEGAKDKVAELDDFAKNAAKNIQDSFADFLFDPFKDGLDGMLQGFGQTIKRIVAEAVAADLAKRLFGDLTKGGEGEGLFGGLLKGVGNLFSGVGGASAGADSASWFDQIFAKGGVMMSPGLSAYSGQIVSKPTVFPFAHGVGLMGEAGPEAILPLQRGADGKLGVAGGGGAGTTITVYVSGNNNAPDVRRAAGQGAREALAALAGAQRYG